MEYTKVTSPNVTLTAAATVSSRENITINNADLNGDIMAIGVHSFYEAGEDMVDSQETSQNTSSTEIPIYLFTTNPTDEMDQLSVSNSIHIQPNQMQEFNEKIGENLGENLSMPITYYSAVSTSSPQLISFVNSAVLDSSSGDKISVADKDRESAQLSDDVFQNYVVSSTKLPSSEPIDNQANQFSQLATNAEPCLGSVGVLDDSDNGKDCSLQNFPNNYKKEVIILTEDSEGNLAEDSVASSDKVDKHGTSNMSTDTVEIDSFLKHNPTFSKNNKAMMIGSFTNQNSTTTLTADELLNSQPVLHMAFNVEAEIADYNGVTLGREITTQTVPIRKPNAYKKKVVKKVASEAAHKTPELKVILTTDVDSEFLPAQFNDEFIQNDPRQHKCPKCPLRFSEKEVLEIHVKCHVANASEDKRYVCYVCGYVHNQWIKMYNHLFSHGLKKPFRCDQCSFTCVCKSDLIAHSYVHSTAKQWKCSKCSRSFKHQRNMKAHFRSCLGLDETGKPKKGVTSNEFKCSVCHKQLSNKRNLDKHMEIHLNLKPYVCNLCGYATRLKESLITHKRLHTGEKPFKCDVCDYSTPDKSSLRRHKRKHTNEKPYSCKYCDYKAIQKHCLDTHIHRRHTGEKFVCGLCHYETYHRYSLNQHFKHHHREELQVKEDACVMGMAPTVVISNNNEENAPASDIFLTIPTSESNQSADNVKTAGDELQPSTSAVMQSQNSSKRNSLPTVQSSDDQPEIAVMQQLQQPGDVVYLQENGSIVIKKKDGRILLIQQMDEDNSENSNVQQS